MERVLFVFQAATQNTPTDTSDRPVSLPGKVSLGNRANQMWRKSDVAHMGCRANGVWRKRACRADGSFAVKMWRTWDVAHMGCGAHGMWRMFCRALLFRVDRMSRKNKAAQIVL